MRIHQPGVEDHEAAWLDQLATAGLSLLRNVATTTGQRSTTTTFDAIPGDRVCTLFTWVEGVELRQRLTTGGAVAAGRLFAQLHEQATRSQPLRPIPLSLHARETIYFTDSNLVSTC